MSGSNSTWREMVNAFVQDNLGSRDLAFGFLMGALSKLHERERELTELRDERDQALIRAEAAENELAAYREFERKFSDAVVDERRAS